MKHNRQAITSYDVARYAGVSQSAVSRCFKPGASVSERMRKRVMRAASELGYEPNAIARSLITRRSNLVGVVMSNLTNLYYPEVLAELVQGFSKQNIRVLIFSVADESCANEVLQQIWPYRVDGVVCATKLTQEHVTEFEKRNVPLIFYNRQLKESSVSSVCCDQKAGSRQLVTGLYEAGHRKFVIFTGSEDNIVFNERFKASFEKLKELGCDHISVHRGGFSYESGFKLAHQLPDKCATMPSAIICANDVMAIGALDAFRIHHGLKAPNDISVVGFDGVGPAAWKSYDLTTIRQPVQRMADATISMLMLQIENPEAQGEKRVFPGILKTGSSARFA